MLYGVLILISSMILAVIIRSKTDNKSCLIKKVLPFIIVLFGGIIATFIVILSK